MPTCLNCGGKFEPKRKTQKFCCDFCRSQYRYKPDILLISAVKRFLTAHQDDEGVITLLQETVSKGIREYGKKVGDPMLQLVGLGSEIWQDVDPDAYVRELREGWE